jgi:hypothetical protein
MTARARPEAHQPDDERRVPGWQHAFRAVAPASPMLRVRYRHGVQIDPYGFPYWLPVARAVVELPPPPSGLGTDELRVVDATAANQALAASGEPLYAGGEAGRTPAGWTWAFLAGTRQAALVPAELHGAFRHLGGRGTLGLARHRRGLPARNGHTVRFGFAERLAPAAVDKVEERLGFPLPVGYRTFLAATNGGYPLVPAVHPDHGFVLDQRLFGLARRDRLHDLVYANGWFADRLTDEFLAIGYLQGGLLAVRVAEPGAGSVWYYDDDDPRDDARYGAAEVCDRLLYKCADTFSDFLAALDTVPDQLIRAAAVAAGRSTVIRPDGLGAHLPANRRPPARP